MTSGRATQADLVEIRRWVLDRIDDFPPLDIVDVTAKFDADPDGYGIFFLTLYLNPPAGDGGWSTPALLTFHEAVGGWAHAAGFELTPHVHLQNVRLADAG